MGEKLHVLAKLPKNHLKFALAYLEDGNATKAAIGAGYTPNSAHVTGSRLLKNVKIRAYLEHARRELEENIGLSSKWVLDKLKEVVEECTKPGRTYNPAAANKALELIGKHLGTFEPDAKEDDKRPAFVGITLIMGPKPSVELIPADAKNKDVQLPTNSQTHP